MRVQIQIARVQIVLLLVSILYSFAFGISWVCLRSFAEIEWKAKYNFDCFKVYWNDGKMFLGEAVVFSRLPELNWLVRISDPEIEQEKEQ